MRWLVLAVCIAGCRLGFDANGTAGQGAGDGGSDGDGDAALPPPAIVTPPASCANGAQDGDETGTDCGGVCERCDHCATATVPDSSCYCNVEWLTPATPTSFSSSFALSDSAAILSGQGGHVLWWDGARFTHGFVGNTTHDAAGGTGPDDIWLAGTEIWHWDGAVWTKHIPLGNVSFRALHARTTTDVWGVGNQGGIYHYDGTSWSVASPFATTPILVGVYALAANDILVAGYDGSLNRWNGATLTPVAGAAFTGIQSMAAVSPTEVYILGSTTGSQTVFRWNGSTFTDLAATITATDAVTTDGPDSVWLLGGDEVAHYTSTAGWTHHAFPTGFAYSTALSSAGRMEIAAANGRVFVADEGKRMTFDGTTWTTVGYTSENFTGIWGNGDQFHAFGPSQWTHGNGTTVTREPPPGGTAAFVWGTSASDLWAFSTSGTAFQYDGSTWSTRGSASGFAAGTSATNVWALSSNVNGMAHHWTGSMFMSYAMPNNFVAADIWSISPTQAWAVGRNFTNSAPMFVAWNGSNWSTASGPPTSSSLQSVWASATSDIWVVSGSAVSANIWHYDGNGWTDVSTASATAFANKVRGGIAGVFVWAQGRLSKWNGTAWDVVTPGNASCPSSPTITLWVGDNDVWLGGSYGMLGHYRD